MQAQKVAVAGSISHHVYSAAVVIEQLSVGAARDFTKCKSTGDVLLLHVTNVIYSHCSGNAHTG